MNVEVHVTCTYGKKLKFSVSCVLQYSSMSDSWTIPILRMMLRNAGLQVSRQFARTPRRVGGVVRILCCAYLLFFFTSKSTIYQ